MTKIIDLFFSDQVAEFTRALEGFRVAMEGNRLPESDEMTFELTAAINRSLADCAGVELELEETPHVLKAVQARFREAIWPWFGQSWFMCRALQKPRGYPGDFELLTAIYNGQTKSSGLGGYLDRYFLNTTLARAVVARMKGVRRFLLDELAERSGDVTILNVASGACREYTEHFDPAGDGRIQLTCVDNDQLALDFVQTRVAPQCTPRIEWEFVRYNALRMASARHNHERFGKPDLLYSVGLCDYIPDKYLIPMLRAWRQTIAQGGAVYVAFKDGDRYNKAEYQWLADWYFYQRSAAECTSLFAAAGFDLDQLQCQRDNTGVILNYVSHGRAGSLARLDEAEETPKAPLSSTVESSDTAALDGV